MTFQDAVANQPAWVQMWLNVLLFGAFILPVSLFIWRQTRLTALITLVASGLAAASIIWMYGQLGYVRLLGLPHIVLWTPLVIYLLAQSRRAEIPNAPKWIIRTIGAVITVSLAFDYIDVARYFMGNTTPF